MKNKHLKAFTLSEVLITLMILGVIAILVIPNIVKNIDRKTHEVKIKKAYSEVVNSVRAAMIKNGCTDIDCLYSSIVNPSLPDYNNIINVYRTIFPNAQIDVQNGSEEQLNKSKCIPTYVKYKGNTYPLTPGGGYWYATFLGYCFSNGIGIGIAGARSNYVSCSAADKLDGWGRSCFPIYVFTDGKTQVAIPGKNFFQIPISGDGQVHLDDDYYNKYNGSDSSGGGAAPIIIPLFRLLKNNWQMDYLND